MNVLAWVRIVGITLILSSFLFGRAHFASSIGSHWDVVAMSVLAVGLGLLIGSCIPAS